MSDPKKWHEVYRNDEERNVFVGSNGKSGLCRNKYDWRTTDKLAKDAGLSKKRTEEILDHYVKQGIVVAHIKDPEMWGYWERVGAVKGDTDPVKKDQKDRIDKQLASNGKKPLTPTATTPAPASGGTAAPKAASGTKTGKAKCGTGGCSSGGCGTTKP